MRKTRVAIADDHPVVREGLRRIVSAFSDLEVVAEASDGQEALDLCDLVRPDVLLLDVSMPGPDFLEILRLLGRRTEKPAVLVLSVHAEEAFAPRALERGASGYLGKQCSPTTLADAIRRVAAGERVFSGSVLRTAERLGERAGGSLPHCLLSPREFQIFLMLGQGMRVADVAERLRLSPKTVSTHRARILAKTGFQDNRCIVRYVAASGLLHET